MDREPSESLTTPATGQASTHQLETAARMVALGQDTREIARLTGLSLKHVNSLINGGHNQKFDSLKETALTRFSSANAGHVFRLLDMAETAYTAYESVFHAQDPKVVADHSKDWMNRCFPDNQPANPTEQPGGLHITQNNLNFGQHHAKVMKTVPGLVDLVTASDPDDHLLSGNDALPRPPGQLEVLDTEPLPGPDETDDSLNLEAIEAGD